MADSSAIEAALGGVSYPLLQRTLGELGLIQKIAANGKAVTVHLLLPFAGHPSDAEMEPAIQEALSEVGGIRSVRVQVHEMRDEEKQALMEPLVADTPGVLTPGSSTRVISISSGKGGVGKSSVTTNLAVALAARGRKVGVMDADVWGFSIPGMLGANLAPALIHESIIPPVAHGVRVMSMDYFVGDEKAVIWRGPMLHKAMEQFLGDVFWDAPDYLLVDTPPGTGDVAISLSQFLPRAQMLIVTTPQPTAQKVARRAGLMAREVDQELIGIVENMSWFTGDDGKHYELFGSGGGERLAEDLEVGLLGKIPLLPAMREGADDGRPVRAIDPEGEVARAFDVLAEAVEGLRPRIRTHPSLVIR